MSAPVAVLSERRARSLAAVDKGYLVFRRHPLSEMSEEQQAKIREAYDGTGFVAENCFSLEIFGFYTDFGMAVKLAGEKQGSWMEVPVNHSLSDELRRHRPQGNPGSKSEQWYEETNPGTERVKRQDIVDAFSVISRCLDLASNP